MMPPTPRDLNDFIHAPPPPQYFPEMDKSAGSGGHKGKRRRNDSDDEDDGAGGLEAAPHKKPVRDIFRQRMQANLTPHDD